MKTNGLIRRQLKVLIILLALCIIGASFAWAGDSSFFPTQSNSETKLGGTTSSSDTQNDCKTNSCKSATIDDLVSEPDEEITENDSTSSDDNSVFNSKNDEAVILYCPVSWYCPVCASVKALFEKCGIKFKTKDSDKNQDIVKKYGNNAVPTMFYKGKYYPYNAGFAQLKNILGITDDTASSCKPSNTCSSAEITSLISQLGSSDSDEVDATIRQLLQAGEQCIDPLINALKNNSNASVRKAAAYILGKIGGEKAIVPLIDTFEDSNSAVVREAEIALGRIGKPAINPVMEKLKNATSNGEFAILIAATNAMIEIGANGEQAAIESLNTAVSSNDITIAAASKYALAKINKLAEKSATIDIINTATVETETADTMQAQSAVSVASSMTSATTIKGNQYWVDSTYTGKVSNGKQATPWKSLASLMSYINKTGLKAGDYIHIKGNFSEGLDISKGVNGTSSKPITFSGSYGKNSKAKLKHIYLKGAAYAVFEDFEVAPYAELPFHKYFYENSSNYNLPSGMTKYLNCVFLQTKVSHVTFTRLYMHDAWQAVVLNPGASHITFKNSDIYRTFLDGIQISDNSSSSNDYFKYIGGSIKGTGYGIWKHSARHGVYLSGGHNHEFNGITFDDNYGGWGLSLRRGGVVVKNCIFKQSKSAGSANTKVGVAYCNEDPTNAKYKVYIYNNLIIDKTGKYGLYFGGTNDRAPNDPYNTFYIFNNTFINCTVNIDKTLKINAYFWNNIVSGGGNNKIVSGGTHGYISNAWINGARIPSGGSTNSDVKADPKFDSNYYTSVAAYTKGGTASFGGYTVPWSKANSKPGIGRSKTKR